MDPQLKLKRSLAGRLKNLIPFGVGQTKPRHFRDMSRILWENKDNLSHGWKVLSRGVCDGCALGVAGFHDWTIDGIHLCMTRLNLLRLNTVGPLDHDQLADVEPLRKLDNQQLRKLGRLAYPMLRKRGEKGFSRIGWDEAYRILADRIRASDPRRLAFFLTSRGITNEVYYVAQKVARLLGTNHIDNAARLCHSPSTGAMKRSLGVAATTCSYKDWWGTDLLVFFGANPANDQPVSMKYIDSAKKLGTKVVLVNPYREPGMDRYYVPSTVKSAIFGSDITDWWFAVAQGGDIAFLYGVLKIIFENGWEDRSFLDSHANGYEQLKEAALGMDWEQLEQQSGLGRAEMEQFAELIHGAKSAVLVWSMGITQHAFGGDAVQMILNLGLTKGYVGRDKCGLMPIRGHSGVQGGAEMGAYATSFPGGKAVNAQNADELSKEYGFAVPGWVGLTAAEMVEAAHRDELDLLYNMGGNFLRTLPDPDYVAEALGHVPLRVHQDIILTDQMFVEGEQVLLLPAQTRYEQEGGGTETTTERRVIFSPQIPREVGEARCEWRILRQLAEAVVGVEKMAGFGCDSGQAIREEIAKIIPSYAGIEKLCKTGDAFQYGGPHLCADWKFPTPDGKAHLHAVELPDRNRPQGAFHCSTRRGKQFNTLIYASTDPITGASRDAVLMNADDAAERHLKHGDRVVLSNSLGEMEARVHLAAIARGNLQVHWPEGNVLLARHVLDPTGKVPDYNAYVQLQRA
ncbi:MAG: FdhF/YdeP family oxidoreductase [Phycisphaerales bacterium]|jgi:molybdopterin-dependent oxidoreductase alpha subunit|nr:FdhF/YdeP family oxidoreductase [Phycisphaerales bacterium]